ncbi:MAG: hypothetical protein LUD17_14695 [Bacteroidales bacterium]|nr:hypothetical protein [Bacteroidales bacterium]MCD8388111.1 hypothetical protein [Bacteroidales bacterium]
MLVTYGVAGLIDWDLTLPAGRATVRIHFNGGAMTKYGITPAEFSTSSRFVQYVIEGSKYFKSGRIVRLRVEE